MSIRRLHLTTMGVLLTVSLSLISRAGSTSPQLYASENSPNPGATNYRYRVIHNFNPLTGDGFAPESSLVMDGDGSLYGTTVGGGSRCDNSGCGIVYKLTASPGNTWTETIVHDFNRLDGAWPYAPLTFDANGVLYGVTSRGGNYDAGVLFRLVPGSDGEWQHSVLHYFSRQSGGEPWAGILLDNLGHYYGSTSSGGRNDAGMLFTGTSNNIHPTSVMHDFGTGLDGAHSFGSLVADASGNFYGVTQAGGDYGFGTVFEMRRDPIGGDWTEIILHSFQGASDGANPFAGLTFDAAGNLYGTTASGGNADSGTVFKLSHQGETWNESILHVFTGQYDGGTPYGQLVFDRQGNLYGTTNAGGPRGAGTVFRLSPLPNGTWVETVLYGFAGRSEGGWPGAGVLLDNVGNIFGTAVLGGNSGDPDHSGVVFELSPPESGIDSQDKSFDF